MIDNFLGFDTEWGGGGTGHWFLPYNVACSDDSFFYYKGQVKSRILHDTGDGSEFYVPYLSHYM